MSSGKFSICSPPPPGQELPPGVPTPLLLANDPWHCGLYRKAYRLLFTDTSIAYRIKILYIFTQGKAACCSSRIQLTFDIIIILQIWRRYKYFFSSFPPKRIPPSIGSHLYNGLHCVVTIIVTLWEDF